MPDTLRFPADIAIQAAADKPARISGVVYSGGTMRPGGWGELVIDLAGAVVGQVPILASHQTDLDSVAGQGSAAVRAGQLQLAGTLTRATAAGQKIIALAKSGVQLQASVGFDPDRREYIPSGTTVQVNGRTLTAGDEGLTIIRSGRLREVSVVSVGADPQTSIDIAASRQKGQTNMADQTSTTQTTTEPPADPIAAMRAKEAAETERISAIRATCRGEHADIEAAAIREGWSVATAELAVLRAERPRAPAVHVRAGVASPTMIEAALLRHMGHESLAEKRLGARALEESRAIRSAHVLDIFEHALRAEGRDFSGGREALIRAAFSSISLPTALGNTANKLAMEAYTESPATWRAFCAIKSANDFKDHTGVKITHVGDLEEIGASAEVKHATLSEETYTYSVDTYARMLRITRQHLVNDDLSIFDDTSRAFGRGAARKLNDVVFEVVMANAASYFAAGHANLNTSAALAHGTLATALQGMRDQTDSKGHAIDIVPRVLLVPTALEDTARQLLTSAEVARSADAGDGAPTGNTIPSYGLELQVEPRLSNTSFTNYSSSTWYLMSGPNDAPFIVAFLNGQQSPTIEFFGLDSEPNTLGVSWRVYWDFGAAQADYRAASKNTA